MLLAQESNH